MRYCLFLWIALVTVSCETTPSKKSAPSQTLSPKKTKKTKKTVKPREKKAIDTYKRTDGSVIVLYDDMSWDYLQRASFPTVVTLPPPPFVESTIPSKKRIQKISLRKVTSRANQITDDKSWFSENKLSLNSYRLPNIRTDDIGDIPSWVPNYYIGAKIIAARKLGRWGVFIYGRQFDGRYLAIGDMQKKKIIKLYDFGSYNRSPRAVPGDEDFVFQSIRWVRIEGQDLYVSHNHRTYAKSSYNQNAYITKLDMNKDQVVWRSQALVSNAETFELIGDTIVSGYGFTAEPDFIYLINKLTGESYDRIRVKSGPDYLIRKGDTLYVRTYNTNYVFKVDKR